MREAKLWRPNTAPTSPTIASVSRCSASPRVASVARKRVGSAMRQVASVATVTFFLSAVTYSTGRVLRYRRRLSNRCTRSKGSLKPRPGSSTSRTIRPKRLTIPCSVISSVKRLIRAESTSTALAAGASTRSAALGLPPARLICQLQGELPSSVAARADRRLKEPKVEVFDSTRLRPDKIVHLRKDVLDRLHLQAECGQ